MAAEDRPKAAMLVYPGVTLLDLVAPQSAFARNMDVHVVAETSTPLPTDSGLVVAPTATFDDCPTDVDLLFVPGGLGQGPTAANPVVREFLRDRARNARYVTSVCGGSLILGAAGLLRGYRATTHWTAGHILPMFGAEYVEDRVVVDRNRITGAGVTAGLDFALAVLAELFGPDTACLTQLQLEYDPQPPFDCGTPHRATPDLVARARAATQQVNDAMAEIAGQLAGRR